MRVPREILALVVAGMVSSAFQPAARAAALSGPASLVTKLGAQLGQVLSDRALSPVDRQQRFRAVLDADFDFPGISRFVLGRYWQDSSGAFHLEFATVLEDYVIQSLSDQFADYSGESIRLTGTHSESEHSTIVSTTIVHPDGTSQSNVDWRVQDTPAGLRIVDVTVAGVSMAVSYREQIAAVIDRDGGQVAAVISTLREKIGNGTRNAASGNVGAQ